jgi:MFS family permease
VCYFTAYLDRVNVGFAALTMNKALGFSAAVFGLGSGIFFVGYFLFEIPSNLLLARVGARRWIARILITWGIISGLTAFVWDEWSFFSIRFLLGLAEAGFYPGIILYLTWWFPSSYRSRIIGIFMTAIPISIILGSVVSSQLLLLDGWLGLQGWQWLFILEAVPPVVLGVMVMIYLTDRPALAKWLRPDQQQWLTARLEAERAQREAILMLSARRCWNLASGCSRWSISAKTCQAMDSCCSCRRLSAGSAPRSARWGLSARYPMYSARSQWSRGAGIPTGPASATSMPPPVASWPLPGWPSASLSTILFS